MHCAMCYIWKEHAVFSSILFWFCKLKKKNPEPFLVQIVCLKGLVDILGNILFCFFDESQMSISTLFQCCRWLKLQPGDGQLSVAQTPTLELFQKYLTVSPVPLSTHLRKKYCDHMQAFDVLLGKCWKIRQLFLPLSLC